MPAAALVNISARPLRVWASLGLTALTLCAALARPAAAQVPDLTLQTSGLYRGLYYSPTYNVYYEPDLLHNYAPNPIASSQSFAQPGVTDSTSSNPATAYVDTPVSVTDKTYSTTVDALLDGQSLFQMTFALPEQDAVTQADALLTADGFGVSAPSLVSSLTTPSTAITYAQTGQSVSAPVVTVTENFGPGAIGPVNEVYYVVLPADTVPVTAPNSLSPGPASLYLAAGQSDLNVNTAPVTTIDRVVTMTTTDMLTQTYDITATPKAANAVPEPAPVALLGLGLMPVMWNPLRRGKPRHPPPKRVREE
jgi:hypothetical protein